MCFRILLLILKEPTSKCLVYVYISQFKFDDPKGMHVGSKFDDLGIMILFYQTCIQQKRFSVTNKFAIFSSQPPNPNYVTWMSHVTKSFRQMVTTYRLLLPSSHFYIVNIDTYSNQYVYVVMSIRCSFIYITLSFVCSYHCNVQPNNVQY